MAGPPIKIMIICHGEKPVEMERLRGNAGLADVGISTIRTTSPVKDHNSDSDCVIVLGFTTWPRRRTMISFAAVIVTT